jgi:DNA transformation protein
MPKPSPILTHILELLRPLKGVSARAMFGGYEIYKDGKMFAIVVEDELFFKVTGANRAAYHERGLKPFTYERKGKQVSLSYYQAPAECLDESRIMQEWAESAFGAAMGK